MMTNLRARFLSRWDRFIDAATYRLLHPKPKPRTRP